MRKAVIDLGTNTFNLLIGELVDGIPRILHSVKVPVLLGMGGINENRISDDAYYRALNAIDQFKETCDHFSVQKIEAIGTSALRDATNKEEFVNNIYRMTGVKIRIVTGDQEAELIRKGVQLSHPFDQPGMIMDIGGGSTEFILCDESQVEKRISLNIGVSRIYQMLGNPKEYSLSDIELIMKHFKQNDGQFEQFKSVSELIGSSGSFETFFEMIHKREFTKSNDSQHLRMKDLMEVLNWTIHSNHQQRMDNSWIIPLRKDMLPISALMVKWIIEIVGINDVWVSPYSLKEGAFISAQDN